MMELSSKTYAAKLQRFRKQGQVWLTPGEIPADVQVPTAWLALLDTPTDALGDWLAKMWSGAIERLPAVEQFFREKLQRPAVFRQENGDLCLLYAFTIEQDDVNFFVGHLPLGDLVSDDMPLWRAFPDDLRHFYQHVHNGWTFFPANSMGPLPIGDQSALTDKLDLSPSELKTLGVNPDLVWPVFHNGAGDYLCLDLRESAGDGSAAGRIWWHEEPTELEAVDFWAVMNAWIEIFVEEADKR
ncbi:SMI1/KNR4 family protein [Burkholderia alba]|uniref:SMI1/KNR4 family protein n=1 Tax=Burkholderia alba TaxID=2683677 RepID=UPI002B055AC6|nr:SMI1/KNR4 family protein [Burkholderia alba]